MDEFSDEEGGSAEGDGYADRGNSLADLVQMLARRKEALWAAVVVTCVAAGVLVALTLPARMIDSSPPASKPAELDCHVSPAGTIQCTMADGTPLLARGNVSSPPPLPPPSPGPPHPPPPPSPPPHPVPPPPSPQAPPPGGQVIERLNFNFRDGKPSNDISAIGVIMHQFDESEDPDMPWKRCPDFCHGFGQKCGCAFIKDRLAAQAIMAQMPRTDKGSIPLWSSKMGGVIFKGSLNRLFCGFPGECVSALLRARACAWNLLDQLHACHARSGGSRARVCNPPGRSDDCVPGCTDSYHDWCDGHSKMDVWCDGDPWKPEMLSAMLAGYYKRPPPFNTHNELIVDAEYSEAQLPGSIEAFWYPLSSGCETSTKCKAYTERMHAKFLQEYHLTNSDVPIVGLRLDQWRHPFVAVPPATDTSASDAHY